MGVSNDAIIAYGLDLNEEIPEGLQALFDAYDVRAAYFDDYIDAVSGTIGESYAVRSAAREKFPVDLLTHCSYDYPMYFLAIRGSNKRASRGYPERIRVDDFKITNEQMVAFNRFCVDIGVDPAQADWHIFSMNG